jgi:hypothetical protein
MAEVKEDFTVPVLLMSRLSSYRASWEGLLLEIGGIDGLFPVTLRVTLSHRRCKYKKVWLSAGGSACEKVRRMAWMGQLDWSNNGCGLRGPQAATA